MRGPRGWREIWPWLLAAAPPIALLAFILRFQTGLPYWDEWHFVSLLERWRSSTLTCGEIWLPHNEHRPVLSKLIFLAVAAPSDWNETLELLANFGIGLATLALLVWQVVRTLPKQRWVVPIVSLMVCSLAQAENWLWGMQSMFFLAILAAAGGFVTLARWQGRWRMLALAAAAGVLMTFSFALGVVYWPIGAAVLVAAHPWRSRRTRWGLALWSALAAIVLAAFFHGYSRVDSAAWLSGLGTDPASYAHYVLNFLGGTLIRSERAVMAGAAGIALWLAAGAALARRRLVSLTAILPFLALSALAVGAALIAGLGRQQFGVGQALASRYVTLSYPFWLTIVVFLAALAAPTPKRHRRVSVAATVAVVLLTAQLVLSAVAGGMYGYRGRYLATRDVVGALRADRPVTDEQLRVLYADTAFVRRGLEYLRANRLGLFRK
jgi:hypothetical protein